MKLILTAEVAKLGLPGDIVEVKDGYGRNFLLPQNKAVVWSTGSAKQIDGIKRARDAREIRDASHAAQLREQIEALKVVVAARASTQGHLFGAVPASDLALAIKKAGGPAVDKRAISVAKPIKSLGRHLVGV
ncbi:MAG: 50S ribosomal protein L9, partial [Actinomycetia bacterium]|nr:50S ribosomal protein L9 [Actinomycetes bacterium]